MRRFFLQSSARWLEDDCRQGLVESVFICMAAIAAYDLAGKIMRRIALVKHG
jgi:hypothetical protein